MLIKLEQPALDLPGILTFKTGDFMLFPVRIADLPSYLKRAKPAEQVTYSIL
jgi:hypothetical protein